MPSLEYGVFHVCITVFHMYEFQLYFTVCSHVWFVKMYSNKMLFRELQLLLQLFAACYVQVYTYFASNCSINGSIFSLLLNKNTKIFKLLFNTKIFTALAALFWKHNQYTIIIVSSYNKYSKDLSGDQKLKC